MVDNIEGYFDVFMSEDIITKEELKDMVIGRLK